MCNYVCKCFILKLVSLNLKKNSLKTSSYLRHPQLYLYICISRFDSQLWFVTLVLQSVLMPQVTEFSHRTPNGRPGLNSELWGLIQPMYLGKEPADGRSLFLPVCLFSTILQKIILKTKR